MGENKSGTLYVVATPIGNLEDITYRAVRILGEVDLIAAEDTRHSRKLLNHYGIGTPLISCHEHNEPQRAGELLERLQAGQSIALISDAGTPCIADPGYRLVQACRNAGVRAVPLPGPSAAVAALSVSGLPSDRFAFEGYLPPRSKARRDRLQTLNGESCTLIFHETPHRLLKALADMVELFGGERQLLVARELTKLHEELYRGTAAQALDHFQQGAVKGDIVLIVAPAPPQPRSGVAQVLAELLASSELPRSEIVRQVAREYGLPRSDVYRASLQLDKKEDADG
ncbi:MAG: 16S rRNA (cytidine(1402)-2'-O)-methyltransferase [Desulfuromonas sp.]|nr:MAG: 16S rRNA (cytidine(1402)-2'-O)-methyltransferase [Desulfuromonas sp.]